MINNNMVTNKKVSNIYELSILHVAFYRFNLPIQDPTHLLFHHM